VREQAVHILKRLRSPDLGSRLPLPVSGTPINLAEIADAMEADVQALDQLTDALTEVRTNLGDSVVRKQAGLKRHRRVFLNVARIQEAYYRLAGLDAHASRIRATVPQSRSASTPPEPAPEVPPGNSNTPPVAVEAA
jgi:ABC-type arginine transport system ATPase subunit